ncbi:MAG: DeoR/GlpR family DNA-binding transcription regulator [Lapillicoccus sp.]
MARPDPAAAAATPSFAAERHQQILQLLAERGRVRNTDLAALLSVTEPTIRKDIADLARQGRLNRTHGGAIALRPAFEPDLPARMSTNMEAKLRIAAACLRLLQPGDAVFLDSGSTVLSIADAMAQQTRDTPGLWNVNILTNAIAVAVALADKPGIRHTVLGGTYRSTGGCFVGPLTIDDLAKFTVNTAFIGVTGLTDQGFTVADIGEAQVKQAVIERARRVVIPMDHTKIGAADFSLICSLDNVTTVVTDEPNPYLDALCAEAGVEVIVSE